MALPATDFSLCMFLIPERLVSSFFFTISKEVLYQLLTSMSTVFFLVYFLQRFYIKISFWPPQYPSFVLFFSPFHDCLAKRSDHVNCSVDDAFVTS